MRSKKAPRAAASSTSSSMMTIVATLPPHLRTEELRDILQRERLFDVRPATLLEERSRRLAVDVTGGEHHARGMLRVTRLELREQHIARHVGHAQIEEDGVVSPGPRMLERLTTAGHRIHGVAFPLEIERQGGAECGLVVDDQHRAWCVRPLGRDGDF